MLDKSPRSPARLMRVIENDDPTGDDPTGSVTQRRTSFLRRAPQPRQKSKGDAGPASIWIVGGDVIFRAGLTYLLAGTRFRVAGSCNTADDLPPRRVDNSAPLVLLAAENGLQEHLPAIADLVNRGAAVVVLSEAICSAEVFAAIEAGARGYLARHGLEPAILLKSLELVQLGGIVIPDGMTSLTVGLGQDLVEVDSASHLVNSLSNGDVAILKLLTDGASNKEIARKLEVAEATVKMRIMLLLRKLRVSNRTQAAMWATQNIRSIMLSGLQVFF